jgi:hypothetical protein
MAFYFTAIALRLLKQDPRSKQNLLVKAGGAENKSMDELCESLLLSERKSRALGLSFRVPQLRP